MPIMISVALLVSAAVSNGQIQASINPLILVLVPAGLSLLGAFGGVWLTQNRQDQREREQHQRAVEQETRVQLDEIFISLLSAANICKDYIYSDPDRAHDPDRADESSFEDHLTFYSPPTVGDTLRALGNIDIAVIKLTLRPNCDTVIAAAKEVRAAVGDVDASWASGSSTALQVVGMDRFNHAYEQLWVSVRERFSVPVLTSGSPNASGSA